MNTSAIAAFSSCASARCCANSASPRRSAEDGGRLGAAVSAGERRFALSSASRGGSAGASGGGWEEAEGGGEGDRCRCGGGDASFCCALAVCGKAAGGEAARAAGADDSSAGVRRARVRLGLARSRRDTYCRAGCWSPAWRAQSTSGANARPRPGLEPLQRRIGSVCAQCVVSIRGAPTPSWLPIFPILLMRILKLDPSQH
jgi:hypothetical protein